MRQLLDGRLAVKRAEARVENQGLRITPGYFRTWCARGRMSSNRKLAYTGLLLGKKSRLIGPILRVGKIAQADANQAKPLLRAEADTF